MFYSQFILAKKGPLGTIWIAAHLERKLRKNQVTDTDIGVSVDSIIFPEVPIALRLSSHLMVGVVRIYSRKVNYLFHDCSEALLKIKQAFRSAAVDLPPEESTAPYHSITLPETFHLDDFELPEAAFEGDIDLHVSSKEQITLQDNLERTGYSTSEFGLDERFGDGNSSHMGLDLEEELLLAKDDPIQPESDDGITVQGQSSLHPTDMDVDDNPSKDEGDEGHNKMDDEPSSSSKQNELNADDLRNNIPNWMGYNLRTPDLNDMLFNNDDDAGPSSSYYQPSPFPCDEPASPSSPEFVSAQAPATPGLMEETVPSRVHESPVLSPQRKASPSTNEETAKVDNFAAPPSDFLHSVAANSNDAVGAEMAKPVQVDSSGAVQEDFAAPPSDFLHSATTNANDAAGADMAAFRLAKPVQVESSGAVQENFATPPSDFLHSAAANANDVGAEMAEFRSAKPVQVESSGAVQEKFAAAPLDFFHSAATNANDVGAEMAEFRSAKPVQVESSGAVREKFAAAPLDFFHSAATNANDAVGAEMADFGLAKSLHVESSGAAHQTYFLRQHSATVDTPQEPETLNLVANVDKLVVNIDDIAVSGQTLPFKATMESVAFVQNTSEPCANGSSQTCVTGNPTHYNDGSVNMQEYNMLASNVSVEPCPSGSTEPSVTGQHHHQQSLLSQANWVRPSGPAEPRVTGHPTHFNEGSVNVPRVTGHPTHLNEGSVNVPGYNLLASNAFLGHNLQEIPPQMAQNNISAFQQNTGTFQQNSGTIPQYMAYNDRSNDMFTSNFPERERMLSAPYTSNFPERERMMAAPYTSNFLERERMMSAPYTSNFLERERMMSAPYTSNLPERERMLSAPYIGFHQTNDLGQLTAEKGITESDGSNKIGSLTSRKRHLEDSMPVPESRTTENLSNRPLGQKNPDAIPGDEDLLASILVGRRTPGLVLDSTPLPPKAPKRQRLTPKTALTPKTMTPKRRVKMDDAMVIHADIIRQQLISTEDIRRIRRKAPCTRTEIWMIEKGSLEDDIFREPMFSCMHKDLNDLRYRTYDAVPQFTVHNMQLQGQVDMSETISADNNNVGISAAKDNAAPDHQLHMVLPDTNDVGISGAKDSAALDHQHIGISGAKDSSALDHQLHMVLPDANNDVGISGAKDSAVLDHQLHTVLPDTSNVGISGAKDSADHQLHMVLPDGVQLDATPQKATDTVDAMQQEATDTVDAMPQEATDTVDAVPQRATDTIEATAAFGLQMPSDKRDNNIEVTEFGAGEEIPLDETNAVTNISAHDDTLDKDCHQDASVDMQRNTNAGTPLFVQDDITRDSATITEAPDVAMYSPGPACAQALDDGKGELGDIVHSDINASDDKEMPTSEITVLEFTQHASDFPQPTEDENAVSAMGENSGLQENNAGPFMDMDNTGHDFAPKECSDFGSAIHDVDTDFLNYDDDGDFDEANDLDDDEPNPDEFQSHEALSGWSSRTKGVARYLKTLFNEESGLGRKNIAIDHLVNGKSRKEASRMFFETLVLSTKDYIQVEQLNPFDLINVKPVSKLLKTDF